jgi:rhodanese-related sulfurtransferase
MKAICRAVLMGFALLALAACAQEAKPASPKPLTFDALMKIVAQPGNTFFLDVREPSEIAEFGSLPGSVNIPLKQLESRLAEVPKGRPVLTMCQRGARAGLAAGLLESKGYTVVGAAGLREVYDRAKDKLVFPKPEPKK